MRKHHPERLLTYLLSSAMALAPAYGYALPTGGGMAAGSASIATSGNQTTITQNTPKAIINWTGFNTSSGETVQFVQPSSSAITLNKISGPPTSFDGSLLANGNVWLINPNGMVFGKDSTVNAGGLLATTSTIANSDFMNGNYSFTPGGNPGATILNEGNITIAQGGLAALVAPNVINSGAIQANLGKVQLAASDNYAVDLYGDGLINLYASPAITSQLVANHGSVIADGGSVTLTTAAASKVVNSLINMDGLIEADSVGQQSGSILIYAAGSNAVAGNVAADKGLLQGSSTVLVSGILDASGRNPGEHGGSITVTGDNVALLNGAFIDASGSDGLSGTTTGQPVSAYRTGAAGGDIRIGGDYLGQGSTPTALNLYVDPGATVLNDALNSGDAGRTIFWSDGTTQFYGSVYARALGGKPVDAATWDATPGGNAGDGGFVETSGHVQLDAGGYVNLTASNGNRGTYFLDPTDIAIYGNVTPTFVSTDGTVNLASGLVLWLKADDPSSIVLNYNSLGTTATGSIGATTLTTASDVSSQIPAGAKIQINGDTYVVSAVSGTTLTLTTPLTSSYSGQTINIGLVTAWNDLSGNGNNVSQATAANQPVWVTNAAGQYAVDFIRANTDFLSGTIGATSAYTTAFTVSTFNGNVGDAEYPLNVGDAGAGSNFSIARDDTHGNDLFTYAGGREYSSFVVPNATWGIFGSATNPVANQTLYYNGASQVVSATAAASTNGDVLLGHVATAGRWFDGQTSEVLIYSRTVDTLNTDLIQQYESAKWNIALTPPGTGATEAQQAMASNGYSVFSTSYLERLSQSADISLQASHNITLDFQGDTLALAGGRALTLNAGNQIITDSTGAITTSNGNISLTGTNGILFNNAFTLNSGGGGISLNGPVTLGANLALNAGSGAITFGGTVNGGHDLTASADALSFASTLGGTAPLSAVSLTSASSLTLPSIDAASIFAQTTGASSDLTIAPAETLIASDSGTAITLASGENFINDAGSGALRAGGGRWLVYSTNPADDTIGGLNSSFSRFSCTYGGSCPGLAGTGNGLLYSDPAPAASPAAALDTVPSTVQQAVITSSYPALYYTNFSAQGTSSARIYIDSSLANSLGFTQSMQDTYFDGITLTGSAGDF